MQERNIQLILNELNPLPPPSLDKLNPIQRAIFENRSKNGSLCKWYFNERDDGIFMEEYATIESYIEGLYPLQIIYRLKQRDGQDIYIMKFNIPYKEGQTLEEIYNDEMKQRKQSYEEYLQRQRKQ